MFRMIRAGSGYNPVIVVTPETADPGTADAKYYELSSIKDARAGEIPGWQVGKFNGITRAEAMMAFSGIADGWGFADCSAFDFQTLDDALAWVKGKREGSSEPAGTWFFSHVSFDSMENDINRARCEERIVLGSISEMDAIREAQRLWRELLRKGTREGWDKEIYPNSPRVYYEVSWPPFAT